MRPPAAASPSPPGWVRSSTGWNAPRRAGRPPPYKWLWVTPLRALAADTGANLRLPLEAPVLAALGGGFRADELLREVRATHALRELRAAQWHWVLDTRGGAALRAYPQYHRVVEQDGVLRVRDRRIATRHRMHVGTITSDAAMRVCWLRGGTLGHVKESFVARLKPGERLVFAGRLLQLVCVRDMTAYVRTGRGGAMVPRWQGGRMPPRRAGGRGTEAAAGTPGTRLAAAARGRTAGGVYHQPRRHPLVCLSGWSTKGCRHWWFGACRACPRPLSASP